LPNLLIQKHNFNFVTLKSAIGGSKGKARAFGAPIHHKSQPWLATLAASKSSRHKPIIELIQSLKTIVKN